MRIAVLWQEEKSYVADWRELMIVPYGQAKENSRFLGRRFLFYRRFCVSGRNFQYRVGIKPRICFNRSREGMLTAA